MDKLRTTFGKQEIGKLGEKIACKYLQAKKYRILDKNFSVFVEGIKFGEIDIIAQKSKNIIFFEVKTLRENREILPEDKINIRKIKKIQQVGEIWIEKNPKYRNYKVQIDAIAIILDFHKRKARIKHFFNI